MNAYHVDGMTRISKHEAFKRFQRGEPFQICPVKLRPGLPWRPDMTVDPAHVKEDRAHMRQFSNCQNDNEWVKKLFDDYVNSFESYNCSWEAGYYAAYYA